MDLRYAVRTPRRRPVFTLVAALTLGLGIGATTAIYTVAYGVLLRPLPYPEPDRLVQVWQVGDSGERMRAADPTFEEWRERSRSFEALAQYAWAPSAIGAGTEAVRAGVALISQDFLPAMGLAPSLGRPLLHAPDGPREALVAHSFWEKHLGARRDLQGITIDIRGERHDVVGVMPPGFQFPASAEVWRARELERRLPSRTAHNWHVGGRLARGIPLGQAQAEMSTIGRAQKQQHGDEIQLSDVALVPLREQIAGPTRGALLVLLGAVACLLLLACANAINLLLTEWAGRRQELAVRLALGASRARLARQFGAEALLLALLGGAAGVLLARWSTALLLALEPGRLPRTAEIAVDLPVLAFAAGVSVLTAVPLGLACALRLGRQDPNESLKQGARSVAPGGDRLRGALLVSQIALALVLLIGAGLLGRSLLRLLDVDPGFRTDRAAVLSIWHPGSADEAGALRRAAFYGELLDRLRGLPGVEAAGGTNRFPFTAGGASGQFLVLQPHDRIRGMEDVARLGRDPSRTGYAEFRVASDGYFGAMGIPVRRGRAFDERDGPDRPHVAVISESLARQRWPDEDPIGRLIQFGNMDGDLRPFTIVGVVGDVREQGLDAATQPTFYASVRQRPRTASAFTVILRGPADPSATAAAARALARQLDAEAPVQARMLDEIVAASAADRRFHLLLLGSFGLIAVLLAAGGIYAVTTWSVAARTHEIGVRMAVGAQPSDARRLILAQSAWLVAAGALAGLFGAFLATRLLRGFLFEVAPADPATFLVAAAGLGGIAAVAAYLPARRASRVDPLTALRSE